MANQADKKRRDRANWYSFRLVSLLPVVAYLLGVLALPLLRGRSFEWSTFAPGLLTWALVLVGALLVGYLVWNATQRSDWIANAVVGVIVAAAGVWTLGLSTSQREDAVESVRRDVDKQVTSLVDRAQDVID